MCELGLISPIRRPQWGLQPWGHKERVKVKELFSGPSGAFCSTSFTLCLLVWSRNVKRVSHIETGI